MALDKEQLKHVYSVLTSAEYDSADPCMNCSDMDCVKSSIRPYLKKSKQFDVIDWQQCIKQRKKENKRLQAIMRNSFFDSVSMRSCDLCDASIHSLDLEMVINDLRVLIVCGACAKAHARKNKELGL